MFKAMRRKRQELPEKENKDILKRGKTGVLALYSSSGYPYAVPLNYFYNEEENKIYFHCAKTGHKIDAVKNCAKVSFCVVDKDEIIPEKYTTKYASVIVFGIISIIEGENERLNAVRKLAEKYVPGDEAGLEREIAKDMNAVCMLELHIEHMSGKAGLELIKERSRM